MTQVSLPSEEANDIDVVALPHVNAHWYGSACFISGMLGEAQHGVPLLSSRAAAQEALAPLSNKWLQIK
jgi:enamine deaminase RidA (YjgF/YER057c/UK114 family)